jgi:MOSC domain-containing protein YiiM
MMPKTEPCVTATTLEGRVVQVSVSNGGVPKLAVPQACATRLGLEGDRHAHPEVHGGPLQALLLVSQADLDALRRDDFPVFPGALGENLTVDGMDFRSLRTGQRFRVGEAVIELTKIRRPCETLDVYNTQEHGERIQFRLYDKAVKAGDTTSPRWAFGGFYAAVVFEGIIRKDDIIRLLDQAV